MRGISKRTKGTTRKIAAARIAVSRANAVLKARSSMSSGSLDHLLAEGSLTSEEDEMN